MGSTGITNQNVVLLEGTDARQVYALLSDGVTRTYVENEVFYQLTARPLLPAEIWQPGNNPLWASGLTYAITPTVTLECGERPATPILATVGTAAPTPGKPLPLRLAMVDYAVQMINLYGG